ncbi:MAG: dTMP kinase [Bacteroidota bacterium]|nr:dTMP kinase [Bacteroidota bacterium]
MNFFVIEGLDASGKSTQIRLLQQYLQDENIPFKYLHFPRTDSDLIGELIAKFLRGELGNIDSVNPYLVALIYALDRQEASSTLKSWLDQKYFVLVDRYVYSNIAFQCAKIENPEEREKLQKWILQLEFDFYKIPRPDLNIFLDVPFNFVAGKLTGQRTGDDRNYLNGRSDIHEQDLNFQRKVREQYLALEGKLESYKVLNCSDEQGKMLQAEKIFEKLLKCLRENHFF